MKVEIFAKNRVPRKSGLYGIGCGPAPPAEGSTVWEIGGPWEKASECLPDQSPAEMLRNISFN